MNQDVIKQLSGFLTAILLFLGTLNIEFKWFTEGSINAFVLVISAGALLIANLISIYKNHYGFSRQAKLQKEELEKQKLL